MSPIYLKFPQVGGLSDLVVLLPHSRLCLSLECTLVLVLPWDCYAAVPVDTIVFVFSRVNDFYYVILL